MSDGDEEPESEAGPDAADANGEQPESAAADTGDADGEGDEAGEVDAESLDQRLEAAESDLDEAETEADLDDVEATLDGIESDLEAADLPEPEDDDEEDPRAELEARLSEARDQLAAQRGPYAEDVVSEVESAQSTIRGTRWTEAGVEDVREAVGSFHASVSDALDVRLDGPAEDADADALAESLDAPREAVENAGLDPDEDAATLETLQEAAATLVADLEEAEEWDDLTVREQLRAEGFYESMGRKHKDFPPEWSALREWENRGNVEMVLLALDAMDSEFMERHCMEALERMADPACVDALEPKVGRRDKTAIRIVGRTGSDEPVEDLLEYVEADGDPGLQKVTMKALGQIGNDDATQVVADNLAAEDDSVRSQAARALGLLGDTRAVEPLADVLADDDVESVRTSAAWALVQIGTEDALEAAAEYADADSYIVQSEAETAAEALADDGESGDDGEPAEPPA